MKTKFKITNVCAVMATGFPIDMQKVQHYPTFEVTDSNEKYTRILPPNASRPTTFFYNGNMISVGNKSVSEAKRNLELTKKFLKKYKAKQVN